jgi:uncharacterized phage protein (TIGR01671 family)
MEKINRLIKFRAWDLEEKVMYQNVVVSEWGVQYIRGHDIEFVTDWGIRYFRMQFTGLFDKNEKEIYEGDILNMTYHGSVSIVKPEIKGVVGFENAAFIVGEDRVPLGRIGRSLEVIGNIYVNPELLESEK